MKKLFILVMTLLPLSAMMGSPPLQVQFFQGSFEKVTQQAAKEGKLYFVHFTADWCMPCQWMDKNTFQDPLLAAYIKVKYLALKINIDEAEGQALKGRFGITALPSTLVFNVQGEVVDRYEASLAADHLLHVLKSHDIPENRLKKLAPPPDVAVLDSPKPKFNVPEPGLARPAAVTQGSDRQEPFGIQAGLYYDYHQAVKELIRLERRINLPVHLFTSRMEGPTLYKIIIGPFPNRNGAQYYLQLLERNAIAGSVKSMTDI